MVTRTYHIDVLLLKDIEGISPFRIGGIIKTIPFNSVARINHEEILPIRFGFLAHTRGEGYIITPVGGI